MHNTHSDFTGEGYFCDMLSNLVSSQLGTGSAKPVEMSYAEMCASSAKYLHASRNPSLCM